MAEWSVVKTCDDDMLCHNDIAILGRGIRVGVEMRHGGDGPAYYVSALGGVRLGKFGTREEARQHLFTAAKQELEAALRSLDELALKK